jgi:ABC-type branched-subunit amino acid transport system ATPase component
LTEVRLEKVSKYFGETKAVDNVDLHIKHIDMPLTPTKIWRAIRGI